ncbi:MAG: UDP-glucose dehydrogenase family protein, partial [Candidatus Heimdallarchaeaceae archaeon]
INHGKSPIYEEGLDELLQELVPLGKLRATLNFSQAVKDSEIIFICVGTPSLPDGSMSYEYVMDAAENIGKAIQGCDDYKVIVVKSTCIPGTTVNLVGPIIEKASGKTVGKDFGLGMNPEFLREGVALKDFLEPDRIVIGAIDERSYEVIKRCYEGFPAPILHTDPSAAEMIKYASNSFLALKISFINEIANLCEKLGIDVKDVAKGVGMDHRISGKFLRAGAGWGGSCFPKDVSALLHKSKELGMPALTLQAAIDVNKKQPLRTIALLKELLENDNLRDKTIAVLGLAFKPGTDDMREAPSIIIINQLLEEGAIVKATDPAAIENAKKILKHENLSIVQTAEEALKDADGCILITEWEEYSQLPPETFLNNMKTPILVDGRRAYPYEQFRKMGIKYKGIGLGK